MSVLVRSLINVSQTLDSVAIGPWATQLRDRSTAALVAAVAAKTIQMDEVDAPTGLSPITTKKYVPAAAETITLPDDVEFVVVDPGATIATLTVSLPVNPYDGQRIDFYYDNIVTTLTFQVGVGSGDAVKSAPTSAAVGTKGAWRYSAADATWYPVA